MESKQIKEEVVLKPKGGIVDLFTKKYGAGRAVTHLGKQCKRKTEKTSAAAAVILSLE